MNRRTRTETRRRAKAAVPDAPLAKDITVAGMDLTGHNQWDGVPTRANAQSTRLAHLLTNPGTVTATGADTPREWDPAGGALASHGNSGLLTQMFGRGEETSRPVAGHLTILAFRHHLDNDDTDGDDTRESDSNPDHRYVLLVRRTATDVGCPPSAVHDHVMDTHAQAQAQARGIDGLAGGVSDMTQALPPSRPGQGVRGRAVSDPPGVTKPAIRRALTTTDGLSKGIPNLTYEEADALAREIVGARLAREAEFAKADALAREIVAARTSRGRVPTERG